METKHIFCVSGYRNYSIDYNWSDAFTYRITKIEDNSFFDKHTFARHGFTSLQDVVEYNFNYPEEKMISYYCNSHGGCDEEEYLFVGTQNQAEDFLISLNERGKEYAK